MVHGARSEHELSHVSQIVIGMPIFAVRELAKDQIHSRGSLWSSLTMSALSLHCDHNVVKQLALTRVVFKSLPTHPELCTGSLDPGSRLGWSSSFLLGNSRYGSLPTT